MKRLQDYVNVFQGSGKINLPKPEGISSKWLFVKAQCGNTHPAASYPFGRIDVGAYTGAYPTGYGSNRPNSCGEARTIDAHIHGFSHMHPSGTGAVRVYYNYALTSPVYERLGFMSEDLVSEKGRPGYYSATLTSGIKFEGTVSERVAYHRYTFSRNGYLQIDFANGGLLRELNDFGKSYHDIPEKAEVIKKSGTRVLASAKFHGVDIYFAVECADSQGCVLWESYNPLDCDRLVPTDLNNRFGAAFAVNGICHLRTAISFASCDRAEAMLDEAELDFYKAMRCTSDVWESYLDRVKIESDDEVFKECFYSNLYHSLIKPCCADGESIFYENGSKNDSFYYDVATMWDMYKTALPLIFTLYPRESQGIAKTFLSYIFSNKRSCINITAAKNNDDPEQARMLMEHSLADYYYRGGEALADEMLRATEIDLEAQKDFLKTGYCERYTHILDICEALYAMAEIARRENNPKLCDKFEKYASCYLNAYDKETGLMSESSPYYEGDKWNYSFRLHSRMEERIALVGKDKFVEYLDRFFGYDRDAVEQSKEPELDPLKQELHSFEGFNNESDMESPYAYTLAGEHDKTCEVISSGMRYMFTIGRGGIPGNNDSGALSSCYVWNTLGIFPVSSQDRMIVGTPRVDSAKFLLSSGKVFEIKVHNRVEGRIYVDRALLNGRELMDFTFTVTEMMKGGTLELYMY